MTSYFREYLIEQARAMRPTHRFDEKWVEDFTTWQAQLQDSLKAMLAPWPERLELTPQWELLEKREKYELHRVTYETVPGLLTDALVGIPNDATANTPAVLCIHGHGRGGSHAVMNYPDREEVQADIDHYQYDYGHQFAKAGVIAFAPSLRGFAQRCDEVEIDASRSKDPCNYNLIQQLAMGEIPLTGQLHDLMCAVDLLCNMAQVDSKRIGCAGLSYGGRMTMFLAALDHRIKAGVVSGAINSLFERLENYASCGYQIIPGMLKVCDFADILASIAPRSLCIELGSDDGCCPHEGALKEFERIKQAYEVANAQSALQLVEFEGKHIFDGKTSVPWMLQQLDSKKS